MRRWRWSRCAGAAGVAEARSAELRIGDHVVHDGRLYVVLGLDPMGVPRRRADLRDVETGERRRVPVAELEPRPT